MSHSYPSDICREQFAPILPATVTSQPPTATPQPDARAYGCGCPGSDGHSVTGGRRRSAANPGAPPQPADYGNTIGARSFLS